MPIQRLGVANPSANVNTPLVVFSAAHLVAVTAANKAVVATPLTKVTIWIVPANATVEAQYIYICYNLTVSLGQSFETFRFAVNPGDSLYVRSSVDTTSFSCNGILQEDSAQPENIAQTFTNKVIRGRDNTLYIDKGTLAERRENAEEGYLRYNTELEKLEVKTAADWNLIEGGYTPSVPSDWNTAPTSIAQALDELAARLRALE